MKPFYMIKTGVDSNDDNIVFCVEYVFTLEIPCSTATLPKCPFRNCS